MKPGTDGHVTIAIFKRALAAAIKNVRTRKRMPQDRLAQAAGVSARHVGGMERGEHLPGVWKLYRIIVGLGVTPTAFTDEFNRCLAAEVKAAGK
jgi:transcriptional regulator with XRE-family HTH domain